MTVSWAESPGQSTADWYRQFAEVELGGVSPTYRALCLGVAADPDVCDLLDTLPEHKRQPNLLLAAVRYHDGPVSDWPEFRVFLLERWDQIVETMRQRRTQTNEARRCAAFPPVLAGLPQPLALLEIGASAGLCLYPDRWSYRYTTPAGEHLVGNGPELRCRATGSVPFPTRVPAVRWRVGLDVQPLDVRDEQDVRWLESLIWPEETERFTLLQRAVEIARADPPRIVSGDLTSDLPELAAEAPSEATLVVYHTAVLAYVDQPGRDALAAAVRAVGAEREVCWLANEAPGVLPRTERLHRDGAQFVLARDAEPIAWAGGHGDSLDWFDS